MMDRCQLPPLRMTDMAMIKIATHLWQQVDLKNLPTEVFWGPLFDNAKHKFSLFEQNCKAVDSLPLQTSEKIELMSAVCEVGVNMFQWLWKLRHDLPEISSQYLFHFLKWDCMGCIDTGETVRSVFSAKMNNPKIIHSRNWVLKAIHLYCLEDCIDHYWSKLQPDEYQKQMGNIFSHRSSLGFIDLYWKHRLVNGYSNFKSSQDRVPEIIVNGAFSSSLDSRNWLANQYFWNKVSDECKFTCLTNLRSRRIKDGNYRNKTGFFDIIGNMKTMRSINCLMNKMTERESKKLSAEWRLIILELNIVVLTCWQWQHLAISMIQASWDVIDADLFYYVLLQVIVRKISFDYQIIGNSKRYHNLIYEIWKDTPRRLKLAAHDTRKDYSLYITELLLGSDVKLMEYIINDETFKKTSQRVASAILTSMFLDNFFAEHINNGNFSAVEDFMIYVWTDENKTGCQYSIMRSCQRYLKYSEANSSQKDMLYGLWSAWYYGFFGENLENCRKMLSVARN